ncbi:transcriptional regulator GutM [Maledivibacter halophilus]|uniref:Glucitol operon activator n=1 Tax=Maledivibacter halophilus TaxID=36842 RepID=A0A1T5M8A9_9FIRM|nr:transcriptional regulator GutM [Maledivibacter halophilus]SKC84375.1 Glucitol operon activator [Maledivibacter halophilus]
MEITLLVIIIGISIWGLQSLFGFFQMKNFKNNFKEMREKGRVTIGFNKGFFFSGVVVLIRINENINIEEVRYMSGVTVLARFKKMTYLNGKNLLNLEEKDLKDLNKLIKKAIFKAVKNYEAYMGGEEKNNYAV